MIRKNGGRSLKAQARVNGRLKRNGKAAIMNAEAQRLEEDGSREQNWKRWGPYLSERQWGTVREDYSADGSCWTYFPHDHARSRAYRWGEDGLLGISDREGRLCFAVALWNGRDPILKERIFGLAGPEGNHGEDVKEHYFYLDSTPTHSYMKALYKYPQAAYPYARLVEENRNRGRGDREFEISDTGVFDGGRYFDVYAEYAKAAPDDLWIRLTVCNRGPEAAPVHLLPTLWFRNTWSWGCAHEGCEAKPLMFQSGENEVETEQATLGRFRFTVERGPDGKYPTLLFTDNETNTRRLYQSENESPYVKDAFHEYLVGGRTEAVNPEKIGTKVAAHYLLEIPAGGQVQLYLSLCASRGIISSRGGRVPSGSFRREAENVFDARIREADEFYSSLGLDALSQEERNVVRQGYAGLLWSKQFYEYIVEHWLKGDPLQPSPPQSRLKGRNADWLHLYNRDVISMPDKWEYPWYAAWDLAFQMIPLAVVDPKFTKDQLVLFLREWYMHPNGQIPAYEFAFSDVNPPVHAWACWRVYKMTGPRGGRDRLFLERTFQKLLLNFTWWVNRKDPEGRNLFSGGFLGLDNIGVFDRSRPLPTGGTLEQADGTAWMAFYCGTMLSMALELALEQPAYEDLASKFFEHFISICDAMNSLGGTGLWDPEDGFYYDQVMLDHQTIPLRVRSLVGIIPLIAVEILEDQKIDRLPGFKKRLEWFVRNRQDLARHISYLDRDGGEHLHRLLAIPSKDRLQRVLQYLLDEKEFLSPYGIRSVSKAHEEQPYRFQFGGEEYSVKYVPGESDSGLFGGNSNWRGPIWFPINFLIVEALERYHHFYGDSLKVECPTGSGRWMTLNDVADELRGRLARLFLPDESGKRPCHGDDRLFLEDQSSKDLLYFHEHFHGDTGRGLGATHQTGWTALIVRLLGNPAAQRRREATGSREERKPAPAKPTKSPKTLARAQKR